MPIDENTVVDGGGNGSSNLTNINIYKINRSDYNTLWNNGAKDGQITVDGQTYSFEDNAIYLIGDVVYFQGQSSLSTFYSCSTGQFNNTINVLSSPYHNSTYFKDTGWDSTSQTLALASVSPVSYTIWTEHRHAIPSTSSSGGISYTHAE